MKRFFYEFSVAAASAAVWLLSIASAHAVVSISPLADVTVNAGERIDVRVVPSDTTGAVPGVYATNLPAGATFDDNLDGTRTFSWMTSASDSGSTVINFIATSAVQPDDTAMQTLTININDGQSSDSGGDENADFYIEPLSDQLTVVENAIQLRVTPRRSDGEAANLTYAPMFPNSFFADNGDGTRTFVYRPEIGQEGVYDVSFIASSPNDESEIVTRTITLTVLGNDNIPSEPETPVTEPETPVADPDLSDPDFNQFRQSLVGVRDYGCESIPEDNFSFQFIEAYTDDGRYFSDNYLYFDTVNCDKRPLSVNSELPVENWILGQPLTTPEGIAAWEIDFTVVQSGMDNGDPVIGEVDSTVRGVVSVGGGSARLSLVEDDPNEPRPVSIADESTAIPYAGVTDPASQQALQGQWVSECFRGRRIARTFSETEFREDRTGYLDSDCSGESYYTLFEIYDLEYIGETTTVFGDSVARVNTTLRETAFDDLTIGSDVPAPPTLRDVGIRFLDIWGVSRGELIIGTCLIKGQGGCGNSEANIPNVLSLNRGITFVRVAP